MRTQNADWLGLRLEPLDTLFFRDGRPFDAAARASGGLPQPQPLASPTTPKRAANFLQRADVPTPDSKNSERP